MGGLVGVQKRAALLRIGGPGDLVVHLRRSPVAMQTATANVAARQARMGAMGRVRGRSKMSPPRFRSGLADHMQKKSPAAVVRDGAWGVIGRAVPTARCAWRRLRWDVRASPAGPGPRSARPPGPRARKSVV